MHIDEAIKNLEAAKAAGTQNIIHAFWEAPAFEMKEGEEWGDLCDFIDENMDWSTAHDELSFHKNDFDLDNQ